MTPARCKTRAQAVAAAGAVFEARIVVARCLGRGETSADTGLYDLEHAYWKRADELSRKPRVKGGGRKGRK